MEEGEKFNGDLYKGGWLVGDKLIGEPSEMIEHLRSEGMLVGCVESWIIDEFGVCGLWDTVVCHPELTCEELFKLCVGDFESEKLKKGEDFLAGMTRYEWTYRKIDKEE